MTSTAPAVLDHAGIAARIPHQGRMCLLDRLLAWTATELHAVAVNHTDADHPLRTAGGLLSACGIEYAAQAMALHGALVAPDAGGATPGYLASVRGVRLAVPRLDTVDGDLPGRAERRAGAARQVLYRFALHDQRGALLVDGRATVVLNTPLATEGTVHGA